MTFILLIWALILPRFSSSARMIQHRHHQVTFATQVMTTEYQSTEDTLKFKRKSGLFKSWQGELLIASQKQRSYSYKAHSEPPMAAIHLASCDLVAFLRTFDRLQRTLFFIRASTSLTTSIGWGVGPTVQRLRGSAFPARNVFTSYAPNLVFRCLIR
jgi:hypothetical protein